MRWPEHLEMHRFVDNMKGKGHCEYYIYMQSEVTDAGCKMCKPSCQLRVGTSADSSADANQP
jgi:hypothetical protein